MRVRAALVRIVDHHDATLVIGPRGSVLRFDGDSAALLRAVLEIHGRPVTRDAVFAELAERSGGAVPRQPVDDLLALLDREAVLVAAAPPHRHGFAAPRRIVLAISGAIAAVDAPALVRGLHALGGEVRVALSRTAPRFVSATALEALTHQRVWRGVWHRESRVQVPHVELAGWAELVLVWPASATTIARIAAGDCSDLVSAITTATRAPVVIAPSMNDGMYESAAVQANLDTLRAHGRWLIHPARGHEVAHPPAERRSLLGPAAPPAAVVEVVRHLLGELAPRPRLPDDAAGWERLWAGSPTEHLPWHATALEPALAAALDRLAGDGRRLLELGAGAGLVAIEAARRGFRVVATDVSATALGRARERAGELPILFALDDVTRSRLDGAFDVVVDVGLLHCIAPERRAAWAAAVTARTAPGGALLVVAHQPGGEQGTHAIDDAALRALVPGFELERATACSLSRGEARLFELTRRTD